MSGAPRDRAADAARLREVLAARPNDRVSWHNLAAAEGDLGRPAESERAARRALALGIPAPETRLVLARALQHQRRFEEAERFFAEAVTARPAYVDAQRDLAQLVWMRTGNAAEATARLDAALSVAPREAGLHLVRSVVLEFAGDAAGALDAALWGLTHAPGDVQLLRQGARLAASLGNSPHALELARRAVDAAPADPAARIAMCEAELAAGRLPEAERGAAALVRDHPHNQYMLALQATAWRALGDERYRQMHDYAALVEAQSLDVPAGWTDLPAFLRDLAAELEALHAPHAHPLQQSVRGGSQVTLQAAELARPAIAALFASIARAVQRYVERVGDGPDPLRSRNTRRFAFTGAWSVRLRSGGHHADHVHPHGWLSSACYIAVPRSVSDTDSVSDTRAGWLRLGRPGIPTQPPMEAEHHVQPAPGRLALFPAYMWHGVEPFESEEARLTVAFDVVPA